MRQSSIRIEYQKTGKLDDVSRHGLLATAYQFAQTKGIFEHWEDLPLKMKSVTYSPADKLKTLWASIIVGCQHTFEINCELGAHEKALAELFGLNRFPDQSQVNRLLRRATQQTVECYREQHFELLCRHSRSRRRKLFWAQLKKGRRYLVADLDQRALVVSGKQFELAEKGYFGRHRGHAGYQLSALFLGGEIGEVVDEYFDPGNTQAKVRVADLLGSLVEFCRRRKIDPRRVILRGDAQFGTPSNIALVESCGFKYLFKGLSPQKAANLAKEATPLGGIYLRVKPGAEDQARWMADLGEHQHCDRSEAGAGKRIECRTLVMVCTRQVAAPNPKHHGKKRSEEEARTRLRHDYFLTNLSAEELSVEKVLEFYDDRATIERYFCDEQYALGAKSVRTWCFYGEALFQYMVATTNNLLRWFKHELLRETEFESYGLKRIIKELMQIPARLIHKGANWIVEVSHLHAQAGKLLDQWHITEIPESP